MASTTMPAELAILGSYPPPQGGVANHVFRLSGQLDRRGISHTIYNAVSSAGDGRRVISVAAHRERWLVEYLARAPERVIYFLSDRLAAWAIGAALASLRGKRVLVRLRNDVLPTLLEEAPVRGRVAGAMLRRMDGVVAVSEALAASARQAGVAAQKVHWIPGFLPPRESEFDRTTIDPAVMEFLENHEPRIAASGRVVEHKGGDLYGLDMLIELARRLRPDFPRVGVVCCFFDHAEEETPRLEELRKKAEALGVGDAVHFNTQVGPLLPAMAVSDVFVRPTNTDGDANSIREAHWLGLPAVASDVVARPDGTLLFRTRDHDDFELQVRRALDIAARQRRRPSRAADAIDKIDRYIDFVLG